MRGCEVVTEPVLDELVQMGGDEVSEARRLLLGEPAGLHASAMWAVNDAVIAASSPGTVLPLAFANWARVLPEASALWRAPPLRSP